MGSNPIRTSEVKPVSHPESAWATVAHYTLTASLGGLCAALADVASTVLWLCPGADRWRLLFVLCSLGLSIGALSGALCAGLYHLGSRLSRRPRVRAALLLSLPLLGVARLLFTGGRMRRLPAQWLLQPLAAVGLIALCALGLSAVFEHLAALRSEPRSLRGRAAGAYGALGLGLHGLDHRVLPRLYEYLHIVLGALCLGALSAGVWLLLPEKKGLRRPSFVVFSVLCGVFAWRQMNTWANVRAEVFGTHAPFVRHAALGLSALGAGGGASVDPLALRRARFAREQRLLGRPAGALPVIHGAHVLLITIDAMRADRLGRVLAGRSITPNLDLLSSEGVLFERAYCQAPHSSYSLSSLHTGEYLHETVALGQRQPLVTMADAMRAAGRHTAALFTLGIFFTESERLGAYRDGDYGFVRGVHVDRSAREQTEAARAEIDDLVRRGEPQGFLWVHYFDAHAPYQGSGANAEAQYDSALRGIDSRVGELVRYARGALARPVIVAVTADHGEEFGEHGGVYHGSTLYDEQLRVPWVISAPGLGPRRVRAPVELVDLAPTLLALTGIKAPATMRGSDLRERMLRDTPEEPVFAAVNTRRMVLRGGYKLIADMAHGVDELYDLGRDPGEHRNLAEREPWRVASLRADLLAWLESLGSSSGARGLFARARLGDPESAPGLIEIALETRRSVRERVLALELLGALGPFGDTRGLRSVLRASDRELAWAAALVLGQRGDEAARGVLLDIARSEIFTERRAAGFALASLGDTRALEPLVESLVSDEERVVLDAIRALGALGDPRAVEPLLELLPDDHVRYRVVLSLGQLGDVGTYSVLARLAASEESDDARANTVVALGLLGDRRAVGAITAMISLSRSEPYAAEALGALGALGRELDGWDARRAEVPSHWGFSRCSPHADALGWRYLSPWSCVSLGPSASVEFSVRGGARERLMVVRVRRANDGPEVPLVIRIDGREVARTRLLGGWQEPRISLRGIPAGRHRWTLEALGEGDDRPTLALDHMLLR